MKCPNSVIGMQQTWAALWSHESEATQSEDYFPMNNSSLFTCWALDVFIHSINGKEIWN